MWLLDAAHASEVEITTTEASSEGVLHSLGIDTSWIISQGISFIMIACIIWFLILKPVTKKMSERQKTIDDSLKNADEIEKRLTKSQLDYLQDHLRIISGVYGLIRPFDGMRPYRLEMKANLKIKSKRLYDFWRKTITDHLHTELSKTDGLLIDLASHEYSKVIEFKDLKAKRIKVEFRQIKGGKVLNMGIQDKIARGQMIDFMAKNLIKDPEKLKDFHTDGYEFEKRVGDELYFITKFVSRAKTPSAI
jgi:hypothetical protein